MKSIKKNFSYNLIYQLFTIFMPLVTAPYIARVLGPSGVGSYSYYFSIAGYFVYFELLGINNYGVRSIAKCETQEERNQLFFDIYSVQLRCSIVVCIAYAIFIISPICRQRAVASILFLYVLSGALDINWYFFGTEQFRITTIRNCLIKLILLVSIFLFVRKRSDLLIYTVIMASSYLIGQLIMWQYAIKQLHYVKPRREKRFAHFKALVVLFIPVIAVSIYKSMDKVMLGMMSTVSEVGYYENAEKIVSVPSIVTVALGTAMLPRMTELKTQKNSELANNYFYKSIIFACAMGIASAFGILGIADIFVPVYYGDEFLPSILIMQVLAITLFFAPWASVIRTQYLVPQEMDKSYVGSVIFGAFINLIANYILIKPFGGVGAALGTVFAEAGVAIYQAVQVRQKINILNYLIRGFAFIIPGIIMYFAIRLAIASLHMQNILLLVITVMLGIFVYLLITILILRLVFKMNIKYIINNIFNSKIKR